MRGAMRLYYSSVLALLIFVVLPYSYTINMIQSPDTVYKVSLISERGYTQEYECKGYRERGDRKVLQLFFDANNPSDRMILNMDTYISMRIRKELVQKKLYSSNSGIPGGFHASYQSPGELQELKKRVFQIFYQLSQEAKIYLGDEPIHKARSELLEVFNSVQPQAAPADIVQPEVPAQQVEVSRELPDSTENQNAVSSEMPSEAAPSQKAIDLARMWQSAVKAKSGGVESASSAEPSQSLTKAWQSILDETASDETSPQNVVMSKGQPLQEISSSTSAHSRKSIYSKSLGELVSKPVYVGNVSLEVDENNQYGTGLKYGVIRPFGPPALEPPNTFSQHKGYLRYNVRPVKYTAYQ